MTRLTPFYQLQPSNINARSCCVPGSSSRWYDGGHERTDSLRGWKPRLGSCVREGAATQQAVRCILTDGRLHISHFASVGAWWLPVHLDPVAVRVKAFERHVGCLIVPFHDGDVIGFHAFHQRAYVSCVCGLEAGMQERWRRLDVRYWVQRQVEPIRVADNDSAVLILLSGGRVEAENKPNRTAGCAVRRGPAGRDG
jgi:hypothetical protein